MGLPCGDVSERRRVAARVCGGYLGLRTWFRVLEADELEKVDRSESVTRDDQ